MAARGGDLITKQVCEIAIILPERAETERLRTMPRGLFLIPIGPEGTKVPHVGHHSMAFAHELHVKSAANSSLH